MWMHEYQAKQLLAEAGVPVPPGQVAATPEDVVRAAECLGGSFWAVKAQIHAGGRGKAGGVVLARSLPEAEQAGRRMLGRRLVTAQTAETGAQVSQVLVEVGLPVVQELYVACALDRKAKRYRLMVSAEGGMEIEAHSEAVQGAWLDPDAGVAPYRCREMAYGLALAPAARAAVAHVLWRVQDLARRLDLALVELNPLAVLADGAVVAMDAKIQVDENALGRQRSLGRLRDTAQEDPRETRARQHGLSYIALDGDIGCMVNGAGLAMATLDLIRLHGGRAANFLDVGGGTTADRVAQAFELITESPSVRAILVNIFGGIVRCDLIAEGLVQAIQRSGVRVPLVVRLEGTHADQGRALLSASGLSLESVAGLDEAAARAVLRARGS